MKEKICKTYKFRLYPNKKQEEKLLETLELCRQTYNSLLLELNKQKIIDRSQIQGILPDLKICDPRLKNVYSKTLQYECYRLFCNLRTLVQLKKNGKKIGSLKFKNKALFNSFIYNQSGFKLIKTGKRCQLLHLSKIGDIPIKYHRNIEGKIKQVTIKKMLSGKWYSFILVENNQKIKEKSVKTIVGIDLGIKNFTMDSDGIPIQHPLFLKKSLNKLAKEQRKLARKNKGSKNRTKQRIKVARMYEKVKNQRDNFLHQLSRKYINTYDCIVVENLDIKRLIKLSYNSRNILDASWNRFINIISYKALDTGKILVKINPKDTSQRCSKCNNIVKKKIQIRIHKCLYCGLKIDRDYNSAKEILKLGLQKIGQELSDFKPVDDCIKPS